MSSSLPWRWSSLRLAFIDVGSLLHHLDELIHLGLLCGVDTLSRASTFRCGVHEARRGAPVTLSGTRLIVRIVRSRQLA